MALSLIDAFIRMAVAGSRMSCTPPPCLAPRSAFRLAWRNITHFAFVRKVFCRSSRDGGNRLQRVTVALAERSGNVQFETETRSRCGPGPVSGFPKRKLQSSQAEPGRQAQLDRATYGHKGRQPAATCSGRCAFETCRQLDQLLGRHRIAVIGHTRSGGGWHLNSS